MYYPRYSLLKNMYILSKCLYTFFHAQYSYQLVKTLTSQLTLKSTALAIHAGLIKPPRTWPGYFTYAPTDCGGCVCVKEGNLDV